MRMITLSALLLLLASPAMADPGRRDAIRFISELDSTTEKNHG